MIRTGWWCITGNVSNVAGTTRGASNLAAHAREPQREGAGSWAKPDAHLPMTPFGPAADAVASGAPIGFHAQCLMTGRCAAVESAMVGPAPPLGGFAWS